MFLWLAPFVDNNAKRCIAQTGGVDSGESCLFIPAHAQLRNSGVNDMLHAFLIVLHVIRPQFAQCNCPRPWLCLVGQTLQNRAFHLLCTEIERRSLPSFGHPIVEERLSYKRTPRGIVEPDKLICRLLAYVIQAHRRLYFVQILSPSTFYFWRFATVLFPVPDVT